ncbi:MAG: tetratricopeptide repeat protein [Chthoniobacterales bacterium]
MLAVFISAAKPRVLKLVTYLHRDWLRALLLAILAVTVHAPALQGERIWDDAYLAHDSPFIKSPLLILEAFRHYLFLDSFSFHYRPVQNISFIIDYFFWNTDAYGFHLTNVLLHATSGVLLYFLLRQLFASLLLRRVSIAVRERALRRFPWISVAAFLVALIWVVHPVHSAAVDYISGRADSLAFAFASAGWLLFLRAQRTPGTVLRGSLYLLAAVSGLLALLSREIACVWIALFVAHLLFVEKNLRPRARIAAPFCCGLVIAIYVACRQLPEWRPGPPSDNAIGSGSVRAALIARSLGDYGRLLIFPTNLHMERTVFDPIGYRSRVDWREKIGVEYLSILGLSVLAALVFGSARRGRGQLMRIFGASWFLAGYLPVSNIVPLNATVAEHWLYLPSVGFLIFLAGWAVELPSRHWKLAVPLALLAVAGLSVRSYIRSTDWVTPETFYRRTFAAGGTSARNGVNLGLIYADRGDYAQAEKIFRKVLEIAPDYPIAQNDLASALSGEGKTKEAEALFALVEKSSMQTRKEYPRTWIGALNLARMRHDAHDDGSALAILDGARKDYPEVWELISLESEILRKTQGPDAAQRLVEDFARANWWHYGAALALGRLYAQKGEVDLADAALRRASWLDVHETEALRLIVLMRLRQNRLDDAFRTQRRSVARQPDEPRQYILLSDILERMGRGTEAHAALAKASQLRALAVAN